MVGGDGTMNEVINGVFAQDRIQTTEVMLGMISVGTGNDWAKMFNIPADYEEAVQTIKQQRTFIQDAGLVQYTEKREGVEALFYQYCRNGFWGQGGGAIQPHERQREKRLHCSTFITSFTA